MEESPFPLKLILTTVVISLVFIIALYLWKSSDNKTTIVFCDVGQGDAAYIRIKNKIDMVVDGGPDNSVLACLGKYMPFYDHTIELAVITHPQKDHYYGFLDILDHYRIDKMFMNQLDSSNESFSKLKEKLLQDNTTLVFPKTGTTIEQAGTHIRFYWPTTEFLANNLHNYQSFFMYNYPITKGQRTNLGQIMQESSIDPNFTSLIFRYEEAPVSILFTGDIPGEVLNKIMSSTQIKSSILKVPHHGSKNGLTYEFLKFLDPKISIISVGKNNRYGHPSPEVLNMFKKLNKLYLRTDMLGSIAFSISGDTLKRL